VTITGAGLTIPEENIVNLEVSIKPDTSGSYSAKPK
jgi:hypothetical protein